MVLPVTFSIYLCIQISTVELWCVSIIWIPSSIMLKKKWKPLWRHNCFMNWISWISYELLFCIFCSIKRKIDGYKLDIHACWHSCQFCVYSSLPFTQRSWATCLENALVKGSLFCFRDFTAFHTTKFPVLGIRSRFYQIKEHRMVWRGEIRLESLCLLVYSCVPWAPMALPTAPDTSTTRWRTREKPRSEQELRRVCLCPSPCSHHCNNEKCGCHRVCPLCDQELSPLTHTTVVSSMATVSCSSN